MHDFEAHDFEGSDLSDDYSVDENARIKEERDAAVDTLRNLASEPSQATIDLFWHSYQDAVTSNINRRTFFHEIVEEVAKRPGKGIVATTIRPLFMDLVKKRPELLARADGKGETPLYSAINLKKSRTWRLVEYMLQCCDDDAVRGHINHALKEIGSCGMTCLNLALKHDVSDTVLRSLVVIANADVLALVDKLTKKTLILHAVQYKRCDEERVNLIRLLLDKDMEIIKRHRTRDTPRPRVETFLDLKYKDFVGEYSVYGEHERSRRSYLHEPAKPEKEPTKGLGFRNELTREVSSTSGPNAYGSTKSMSKHEMIPRERFVPRDRDNDSRANARDLKSSARDGRDSGNPRAHQEKGQEHWLDKEIQQDSSRPETSGDGEERVEKTMGIQSEAQASAGTSNMTPNTPLEQMNTSKPDTQSPRITKKKPSKSVKPKVDPETLVKNSEKIRRMLKLHYMRTRDVDLAVSFLYGKNLQDVHICFEYAGPRTIRKRDFIARFGQDLDSGLSLDEVLTYVRFPAVTVEHTIRPNEERTGKHTKSSGQPILGSHDMEFFFDWLYDKGVRRILTVEVDDRVDTVNGETTGNTVPHSDESIRKSLDRIVVEHLDWKKMDLDPQVICRVSSQTGIQNTNGTDHGWPARISNDLREVTLEWSGNNTALRAWSEPEGLPQLPNLEVVNLNLSSLSNAYDSSSYIRERVQEFKDRLNTNTKNATGNPTETPKLATSQTSTTLPEQETSSGRLQLPKKRKVTVNFWEGKKVVKQPQTSGNRRESVEDRLPYDQHEWITSVGDFSAVMWSLWNGTTKRSKEQLKASTAKLFSAETELPSLNKPVVVALIDDGVDSFDPAFSNRIIQGKTFDYHDGWVGQHYSSAQGHGTEMAKLICKVCPMAEIYSIRLKTHISLNDGHSRIDPTSAARAIDAALDKEASIISMSWTIPKPEEGSEVKQLLDRVLERACRQNTLLFCSPPDSVTKEDHYPWAYKPANIFLIGAAHSDGTQYNRSGKQVNFIFPGVNVSLGQRKGPANSNALVKETTGSSIATALAAGLAALIICCFKTSAIHLILESIEQHGSYNPHWARVSPENVKKMSQHKTMTAAFTRIGNTGTSKFVQVWKMLPPGSAFFDEDSTEDEKMRCVINFCTSIYIHS